MHDASDHTGAPAAAPEVPAPQTRPHSAVVRPEYHIPPPPPMPEESSRRRSRTSRVLAAVLAMVAVIAVASLLAIGLAPDTTDDVSTSGVLRPATPEEVEALTGPEPFNESEAEPDIEETSADPAPQSSEAVADGASAAADSPAQSDAAPARPEYLLPEGVDQPVVAVAATVKPSVVLVTVSSTLGLEGLGSGIIWDAENGYIVTNQHVVEDADSVEVTLFDGTRLDAEVIGGSSGHDVAVVQIDPDAAELVEARFAPVSSVEVGELAVAVGSPLGLAGTVTAGIVSAVRIQVQGGADANNPVPLEMIQTDASINQGNSGGALANWAGEVIGMNTLIQTTSGGSVGLGFAVPSDTVQLIAQRVVEGESLELGYLGVSGESGSSGGLGVLLIEVVAGSPAERAGLQAGDRIVRVDGETVDDISELSAAIKLRRPGEAVELAIRRGDDFFIVTAVLDPLG